MFEKTGQSGPSEPVDASTAETPDLGTSADVEAEKDDVDAEGEED